MGDGLKLPFEFLPERSLIGLPVSVCKFSQSEDALSANKAYSGHGSMAFLRALLELFFPLFLPSHRSKLATELPALTKTRPHIIFKPPFRLEHDHRAAPLFFVDKLSPTRPSANTEIR